MNAYLVINKKYGIKKEGLPNCYIILKISFQIFGNSSVHIGSIVESLNRNAKLLTEIIIHKKCGNDARARPAVT